MGLNRRNPKAITTLDEDLAVIGLSPGGAALATRGGSSLLSEDNDDDDSDGDPIDGSMVTGELLDRILALDFDELEEEDFDELLSGLAKKELPEGNPRLKARTEEVVEALIEGRIMKILKRGGKGFKRIVKKTGGVAVKAARKLKKYFRTAGGKKSKRKKKRVAKKSRARRFAKQTAAKRKRMASDVAVELESMLSESVAGSMTDRDEIMQSIADIFDLLEADFADTEVGAVLDECLNPLVEAANSGAITEDNMDEDEFMGLVKPALTLIARSLEKLEEQDDDDLLGNLQGLSD